MNNIILIHPFEVTKDQEETFLLTWKNIDSYTRQQPGFIKTMLHQSMENLLPFKNTIYNFVNVAYWESANDFHNAIKNPTFQGLSKNIFKFSRYPGIYKIIEE